jgi:hypothetical protein
MNLTVITQALSGGVAVVSDPLRDREYKRARRQISDGIQGAAIGAALAVAASLAYFVIGGKFGYIAALGLALLGVIKLFKSIGSIIDARVGPKLLDQAPPRATGGLSSSQPLPPVSLRPSQRLASDSIKAPSAPAHTRPVSLENNPAAAAFLEEAPRHTTGRINREYSSPLKKRDKDDEVLSNLRN